MKEKIYFSLKIAAILLILACFLHILSISCFSSDSAVLALIANDVKNGNILYNNWYNGGPLYITTTLPFLIFASLFFKIHQNTLVFGTFLIYAALFALSLLLIKDDIKKIKIDDVLILLLLTSPLLTIWQSMYYHGGTCVLAFLTFYFIKKYYEDGKNKFLIFATLSVALAVVGDFSIFTLCILPLLLYSLYKTIKKQECEKNKKVLLSSVLAGTIGFFLFKTYVFLSTIKIPYKIISSASFIDIQNLGTQIKLTIEEFLMLFGANFFSTSLYDVSNIAHFTRLLVLFFGIYLLIFAITKFLKQENDDFIQVVLSISILIYILFFTLTTLNSDCDNIRYLPYLPFAFGIFIMRSFKKFNPSAFVIAIFSILLAFSFLFEYKTFVKTEKRYLKYKNLIQVLKDNNLEYGRAEFWSAEYITLLSENKIKIHAIIFNGVNVHPYLWFCNINSNDDIVQFLITNTKEYSYYKNLYKYKKVLTSDDFVILVLDKPIYIKN